MFLIVLLVKQIMTQCSVNTVNGGLSISHEVTSLRKTVT